MFRISINSRIHVLKKIIKLRQPASTATRSADLFSSHWLFSRVDNSPLVAFRMVFGLLIFLESVGAIFTGWVNETFIEPSIAFTFIGFEWLQPLPGYGMYGYYLVMGLLGLMIMVGWYYRFSVVAFMLLWWAAYLMQKSHYNNHYYLLILLCLLMALVPAHRYVSIDAWRSPALRRFTCQRWHLLIFIVQLAIVYTYAAVAKLYPDWLAGMPIRIWFGSKVSYPIIGPLLQQEWVLWAVVYGGIAFDLLAVPLLLWKQTRLFAFIWSLSFHLFNSVVFQIGIFPYLMIGMSVFFFPPDTSRRMFFRKKPPVSDAETSTEITPIAYQRLVIVFLVGYLALQILLPLRHWLYPGNVHWTEEGHRMAWQMMMRTKSGFIYFRVVNPATQEEWMVYPSEYVSPEQEKSLATHPDMIWQFVQFLKKAYAKDGIHPEIYAVSKVSLNGRPSQPLVDDTVDLAKAAWHPFRHSDWLLPMQE